MKLTIKEWLFYILGMWCYGGILLFLNTYKDYDDNFLTSENTRRRAIKVGRVIFWIIAGVFLIHFLIAGIYILNNI